MATYNVELQDNNGNSYRPMANPDSKAEFSAAGTRANISPGETHRTLWGKIYKWFADLKTVAFSGSYADLANKPSIPGGAAASQGVANNCTTTAAGYVLDARQGKTLMDKANQISSDLGSGLNGCKVSYESGDFYGTYGGVKKKLGSGRLILHACHICSYSVQMSWAHTCIYNSQYIDASNIPVGRTAGSYRYYALETFTAHVFWGEISEGTVNFQIDDVTVISKKLDTHEYMNYAGTVTINKGSSFRLMNSTGNSCSPSLALHEVTDNLVLKVQGQ